MPWQAGVIPPTNNVHEEDGYVLVRAGEVTYLLRYTLGTTKGVDGE